MQPVIADIRQPNAPEVEHQRRKVYIFTVRPLLEE